MQMQQQLAQVSRHVIVGLDYTVRNAQAVVESVAERQEESGSVYTT